VARLLARRFRSIDALLAADGDDIGAVEGIGPEIVRSLRAWAEDWATLELVDKLRAAGVRLSDPEPAGVDTKLLDGLAVVITGTLDGYSRDQARAAVEDRGGRVTGSVSKKTSALIVGESPGSKFQRARELGVPVLDEEGFARLLSEGPSALT
jgi:DNA ligase (NAD+)